MVTDPEPVPTQPNKPRVRVVDLTSRLGAAALGSLHPDAASGSAWLDLPIVGLPGDLLVDWHHPESALDLATSRPTPLGLYVLVGPGATPRLPDILARLADTGAAETVFLLAPNALMERLYLRENAGRLLPSAQPLVLQLPTSPHVSSATALDEFSRVGGGLATLTRLRRQRFMAGAAVISTARA